MDSVLNEIHACAQELPPDKQAAALEFIKFLLHKTEPATKPERPGMKLDWAGGLKDLRDQYTSLELQNKINEWREEDALAH